MNAIQKKADESGYTLVETLVAMALFLGVLLPTLGILAQFLFDRSPDRAREALFIAQSALNQISPESTPDEGSLEKKGSFILKTDVSRSGRILTARASVFASERDTLPIVTLSRTFVTYELTK